MEPPPPPPPPSPTPPPSPAPTRAAPPTVYGKVTVDPSGGPPGTAITVTGSQLFWNSTLTLVWDGNDHTLSKVVTDRTGGFRNLVAAPDDTPGNHSICLAELPAVPCDVFNLTPRPPPPSLRLAPAQVEPGAHATVTGESFQPDQSVTLTFGENGAGFGSAVADYRGSFQKDVVVPKAAPGSYQVCAKAEAGEQPACAGIVLIPAAAPVRASSFHLPLLPLLVVLVVALAAAVLARRLSSALLRRRGPVLSDSVSIEHRVGPPVLRSTHREWWDEEPGARQRPQAGS
jgi:hypothetical protein